jgi:glutamate formiminotransferase
VLPLESVPNVSEGRDPEAVASIGEAFASRARLLDVHSDPDHHRTVYTLIGTDGDAELVDALLAGIARAAELIDLRRHDGVHPRVGAADVVPLVPLRPGDMGRALEAAMTLARRVGVELELPVFLYGASAGDRRPAFFRQGGTDALQARLDGGELAPDFGPARLDDAGGAVLVGARSPLIAFNVDLATDDVDVARVVAAAVRESAGGFAGVQALGLRLARGGRVQVSMNLLDVERTSLHEVVARLAAEAAARGVDVAGAELVGLLPAAAVVSAAAPALRLPALDPSRIVELRVLEYAAQEGVPLSAPHEASDVRLE